MQSVLPNRLQRFAVIRLFATSQSTELYQQSACCKNYSNNFKCGCNAGNCVFLESWIEYIYSAWSMLTRLYIQVSDSWFGCVWPVTGGTRFLGASVPQQIHQNKLRKQFCCVPWKQTQRPPFENNQKRQTSAFPRILTSLLCRIQPKHVFSESFTRKEPGVVALRNKITFKTSQTSE